MFHLHESSSNGAFLSFTNTTTGSAASDGALIGIQDNESLIVSNKENNHIEFHTDNTERIRITSGGEVNIGGNYTQTNAPLCVTTNANDFGIRLMSGSNTVFDIVNNDAAGNAEIRAFYNNNSGTRAEGFRLEASGNSYFLGGNFGIGTNAPTETITLNHANGASIGLEYDGTENGTINVNSAAMYARAGSGKHLILGGNATEALRLKSDGKAYFTSNLGIGGQTSPGANIHINDFANSGYELKLTGNALQFNRTSSSYIDQLNDTGSILFRMGSSYTEAMRITSGRQVNIGGDFSQTGFTANITRNSSETDILRIKGNGGNAFIRFEDNDASSSFTLGADDAVGSGGFALYDRSDSAYRVVVDTAGRVSINSTSPAQIGGQTPYLYVAGGYANLDGLRIRGLDTGNTLWKDGGDMSLTVALKSSYKFKDTKCNKVEYYW